MAQCYAQLIFKGGMFLGEGLTDFARVRDVARLSGSVVNMRWLISDQPSAISHQQFADMKGSYR